MRYLINCLSAFFFFFILIGCTSSESHKNSSATGEDSIEVKALYIGLIDSHSIEVIIDQTETAIQISEEQYKTLESLQTNTPITITYFVQESTSQYLLEHVDITK